MRSSRRRKRARSPRPAARAHAGRRGGQGWRPAPRRSCCPSASRSPASPCRPSSRSPTAPLGSNCPSRPARRRTLRRPFRRPPPPRHPPRRRGSSGSALRRARGAQATDEPNDARLIEATARLTGSRPTAGGVTRAGPARGASRTAASRRPTTIIGARSLGCRAAPVTGSRAERGSVRDQRAPSGASRRQDRLRSGRAATEASKSPAARTARPSSISCTSGATLRLAPRFPSNGTVRGGTARPPRLTATVDAGPASASRRVEARIPISNPSSPCRRCRRG